MLKPKSGPFLAILSVIFLNLLQDLQILERMNSRVDNLAKPSDFCPEERIPRKEVMRLRMNLVKILDNGKTLNQFVAIFENKSRDSLG